MLQVAFAGTFPASLAQPVRHYLTTPCEIVVADETGIAEYVIGSTLALTCEFGRLDKALRLGD
jgi:hypothetical protein